MGLLCPWSTEEADDSEARGEDVDKFSGDNNKKSSSPSETVAVDVLLIAGTSVDCAVKIYLVRRPHDMCVLRTLLFV